MIIHKAFILSVLSVCASNASTFIDTATPTVTPTVSITIERADADRYAPNLLEGDIVVDYNTVKELYGTTVANDLLHDGMIQSNLESSPFVHNTVHGRNLGSPAISTKIWKGGVLYWTTEDAALEADLPPAFEEITQKTGITFKKGTDINGYVNMYPGTSCSSLVGRYFGTGRSQNLSLAPGCHAKQHIVVHELLHALGMWHEQSMHDRDDYVTIVEENITPGKENNFRKHNTDTLGVPYDYYSVMHYNSKAFSENGLETIVTKDPSVQETIGRAKEMSVSDAIQLQLMYHCTIEDGGKTEPVTNPEYSVKRMSELCSTTCPCNAGQGNCNNDEDCKGQLICRKNHGVYEFRGQKMNVPGLNVCLALAPTNYPTPEPTPQPTERPTPQPTKNPTKVPTPAPTTPKPTKQPTKNPTPEPTKNPTKEPTKNPTENPTNEPTNRPTSKPTNQPTNNPTNRPTDRPTDQPTKNPTKEPTDRPTNNPTQSPSNTPTKRPTPQPSPNPTTSPTKRPSQNPTSYPTKTPTKGGKDPTCELGIASEEFCCPMICGTCEETTECEEGVDDICCTASSTFQSRSCTEFSAPCIMEGDLVDGSRPIENEDLSDEGDGDTTPAFIGIGFIGGLAAVMVFGAVGYLKRDSISAFVPGKFSKDKKDNFGEPNVIAEFDTSPERMFESSEKLDERPIQERISRQKSNTKFALFTSARSIWGNRNNNNNNKIIDENEIEEEQVFDDDDTFTDLESPRTQTSNDTSFGSFRSVMSFSNRSLIKAPSIPKLNKAPSIPKLNKAPSIPKLSKAPSIPKRKKTPSKPKQPPPQKPQKPASMSDLRTTPKVPKSRPTPPVPPSRSKAAPVVPPPPTSRPGQPTPDVQKAIKSTIATRKATKAIKKNSATKSTIQPKATAKKKSKLVNKNSAGGIVKPKLKPVQPKTQQTNANSTKIPLYSKAALKSTPKPTTKAKTATSTVAKSKPIVLRKTSLKSGRKLGSTMKRTVSKKVPLRPQLRKESGLALSFQDIKSTWANRAASGGPPSDAYPRSPVIRNPTFPKSHGGFGRQKAESSNPAFDRSNLQHHHPQRPHWQQMAVNANRFSKRFSRRGGSRPSTNSFSSAVSGESEGSLVEQRKKIFESESTPSRPVIKKKTSTSSYQDVKLKKTGKANW